MRIELLIVKKIKNITTHRRSVPLYNIGVLISWQKIVGDDTIKYIPILTDAHIKSKYGNRTCGRHVFQLHKIVVCIINERAV